jgi:hypothetical protein
VFLEARKDAAKAFGPAEEPLDFVALLVEGAVILPRLDAVGLGGTDLPPGNDRFQAEQFVLAPYVFEMSPGYLEAAGTRLLQGSDVSWHDTTQTPYVAVVNETLVQKSGAKRRPSGQSFVLEGNLTEVVGVAEDGKYHDLEEAPQPVVYRPFSQGEHSEAIFVVRSWRQPSEIAGALQRTLSSIEPNAPITTQSWADDLDSELFPAQVATVALGALYSTRRCGGA